MGAVGLPLRICSKKIRFSPDTDTFYFDQQAVFALASVTAWRCSWSTPLYNAQKVTRIGVDDFSVGTKGVDLVGSDVQASHSVIPIIAIEGGLGMSSSMSEEERCEMLKKLVIAPFEERFRAVVQEHSEYKIKMWGTALDWASREIGWMDFLFNKSPSWATFCGQRYQVCEKMTYSH